MLDDATRARGLPLPNKYEVEDGVIRAGAFSWEDAATTSQVKGLVAQTDADIKAAEEAQNALNSQLPEAPPEEVPAWRVKAVAKLMGLTDSIDAVLASLPEPQRTVATFAWNEGNVISRTSPTTVALGQALGLTSAQIEEIFIQANNLPV